MSSDTKDLVEQAARNFLEEVPGLKQLQLILQLDLRSKRESQMWEVDFPECSATKGLVQDAKVTVVIPRSHFNELARDGKLQHWRDAFTNGYVRATGREEILKLVGMVIERQEERSKLKKRRA